MTERNPPVWMQSGTYSATDDRMVTSLLTDRTIGIDGQSWYVEGGVVPPLNQLQVLANNTMNLTVNTGMIIIRSMGSNPPGAYLCYNDGPATIGIDIEASGNPRVDIVFAEAEDVASGGVTSVWRIAVKKGTPSANPTWPSLLSNQYPLAIIRVVPASQNGGVNKIAPTQVTDYRTFAAAPGGIHLKWGMGLNPAHSPGRMLYNAVDQTLYVSNGATWSRILNEAETDARLRTYPPTHSSVGGGYFGKIHKGGWYSACFTAYNNWTYGSANALWCASRSGGFRVTLMGLIRQNPDISPAAISTTVALSSVGVYDSAGNLVYSPNSSWASIQHRSPYWSSISHTMLINGLAPDTGYLFRQLWWFTCSDAATASTTWVNVNFQYMFIDPIF